MLGRWTKPTVASLASDSIPTARLLLAQPQPRGMSAFGLARGQVDINPNNLVRSAFSFTREPGPASQRKLPNPRRRPDTGVAAEDDATVAAMA
jgi:hypothetical protein